MSFKKLGQKISSIYYNDSIIHKYKALMLTIESVKRAMYSVILLILFNCFWFCFFFGLQCQTSNSAFVAINSKKVWSININEYMNLFIKGMHCFGNDNNDSSFVYVVS